MFGIGIPELILILIVGLIVFGPSKLPEIGRAVGKGLREFRKASNALQAVINAPDDPPVQRPSPAQSPEPAPQPAEHAGEEPKDAGNASPGGAPPPYCAPTQESVRAQLEEKQKDA